MRDWQDKMEDRFFIWYIFQMPVTEEWIAETQIRVFPEYKKELASILWKCWNNYLEYHPFVKRTEEILKGNI